MFWSLFYFVYNFFRSENIFTIHESSIIISKCSKDVYYFMHEDVLSSLSTLATSGQNTVNTDVFMIATDPSTSDIIYYEYIYIIL